MLPLRAQTTACDSHHAAVFALTRCQPIINGTINKGIYFRRMASMPRSTKAVVALHLTKTAGSSFTDLSNDKEKYSD